jgi:acetyl-CoA carboxylase carboxyltransferase component
MEDALLDVLPELQPQAVRHVRRDQLIVDDGEWLGPQAEVGAHDHHLPRAAWAGARSGIVASQPRHLGGILDNDSADKAARFVTLCDAFGIPLVFLVDVPGLHGRHEGRGGRDHPHGAKMLHAVASATVPKITVVLRKAYGAGYYVMNGRAYEPDLIVAWPERRDLGDGRRGRGRDRLPQAGRGGRRPGGREAKLIDAYRGADRRLRRAGNGMIDDVIDPRETRPTIITALSVAEGKKVERPWRRHGVIPV